MDNTLDRLDFTRIKKCTFWQSNIAKVVFFQSFFLRKVPQYFLVKLFKLAGPCDKVLFKAVTRFRRPCAWCIIPGKLYLWPGVLYQIFKNPVFLPRLFLGPRSPSDNFLKKLWRKQICHTLLLVICDLLVTHHPPSTISKIMPATSGFVFVITFSNIIHRT